MTKAFLGEGAFVAVNGRNRETVAKFEEEFAGQPAFAFNNDITDYEEMENTAARIIERWGKIDILINNAGIVNLLAPSEKMKKNDFDRVIDVNLKGTFYTTQVVGKKMIEQKSGRIINIASQVGLFGDKGFLPYAISKSALFVMTRQLCHDECRDMASRSVLSHRVYQGRDERRACRKETFVNFLSGNNPHRMNGNVDELISTILFLASDSAQYINGETIVMDGGMTGYTGEGLLDFIATAKNH
jgi:NAD(P)-dependent dehydrogenase (short-subunit alcohol dehydrogenase family)